MESNASLTDNSLSAQPLGYFRVLRERKLLIVATVVIAVALALTYSVLRTPVYRATAQVMRQTAALDQTLFGTSVFEFQDATRQLQTGANLVKIDIVGAMVRDELRSQRTVKSLLQMTQVTAVRDTDILEITVTSADPGEAADLANSFATQFIKYRQEANRSILAAADQQVVAELADMSTVELASERGVTLSQKHEELAILQAMQTGGFELVQKATPSVTPFSPKPFRNAGFAVAGGLIFGILLAFLLDYVDRRIKTEQDMEAAFGLPVLAGVPTLGRRWLPRSSEHLAKLIGFREASSPYFEAFRTLRSNLRFFQGDKRTQTLLVTSGLPEEGKTVTAVNLALSLALSGVRVILIEADLRRPMLHEYLKLSTRVGVSSVLANTVTFEEALQVVKLADFAAPDSGYTDSEIAQSTMQMGLLCVTSGPLPPNPGELLSSQRMTHLLNRAASLADCVIVDTPPLLLVSDAINLANHTDGVIIATRMKATTFNAAREVRTMLERSGARALGIVANGVGAKQGEYYRGHYKGYYEHPHSA